MKSSSSRGIALFLGGLLSAAVLSARAEVGPPEKEDLRFGFIKLTDMAPLAVAYELGYFEDEGLSVWQAMKPHIPMQDGKPVHPIKADALKPVVQEYRDAGHAGGRHDLRLQRRRALEPAGCVQGPAACREVAG